MPEVKAWYIGESVYLKKILGTGFNNTLYVTNNGITDFYYDSEEVARFEKFLELIGEEEFGEICTNFMLLIDEIPNMKTDEDKLNLFSKMIPALTIFNEFDQYPEYMEGDMQRRLKRVRTSTESKPYELLKNISKDYPKDFIYFKGKLYLMRF